MFTLNKKIIRFFTMVTLWLGVISLLAMIPIMLALYLVIHNDALSLRGDYLWFPFLIFATLALFSALTLVHYRET